MHQDREQGPSGLTLATDRVAAEIVIAVGAVAIIVLLGFQRKEDKQAYPSHSLRTVD